ncbi:D-alanyl-D-alanine carboxypeptidase family protein [Sporosarcina sp. 179-K 3D1 HS]|uniref:D-alanyl-D-alanine carboxypeptidase family protein n=1 Tax=Sporosarcina sp. 179-K 3D1 HS TaxID=3232169 RepID=UPI0039A0C825
MLKRWGLILLILVGSVTWVFQKEATFTKEAVSLSVPAKAVLVMEADSGNILYEENGSDSLPIASMTKLMTQYLVMNAVKNGKLSWDSLYVPSESVLQMTGLSGAVKLGLEAGAEYSVRELFTAMTVISANDAAVALAEMVAGTEEAFVEMMNAQARAFDLQETAFYNSTGLDGEYIGRSAEETNHSSARDVGVIAKELIARHPAVLEYTRIQNITTRQGVDMWSTNLMLDGMPQAMSGIDGLKTGYTEAAGSCFSSTGVFDGRRVISVVIGVEAVEQDTIHPRFELTRELIDRFVLN